MTMQYLERDTLMHRLTPALKIVWFFVSDIPNLCLLSFSLHQSYQCKKSLRVSFRFLQKKFFFKAHEALTTAVEISHIRCWVVCHEHTVGTCEP